MTASLRRVLPAGLIVATALVAGCDRTGSPVRALGRDVPPPDEFAVLSRAPLRMPPGMGLPEPRPGAPSPLDPRPQQEAAMALLGTPTPARSAGGVTAAEAALLESADAAAASEEVRVQLARDRARGDEVYDPPTIFELFGIAERAPIPPEERLDPVREAQRLQRTGVSAPSDPLARPEGAEEIPPQQVAEEPEIRTFSPPIRRSPRP